LARGNTFDWIGFCLSNINIVFFHNNKCKLTMIKMILTNSRFWIRYRDVTPICQMRTIFRTLCRPSRRNYCWKKLKHRLALEWSYHANFSVLRRSIRQATAREGKRLVIAISQIVHLGDIVACEPVVRQIRSEESDAFIVFASSKLPGACGFTSWSRLCAADGVYH
jgi:hypothetical protein